MGNTTTTAEFITPPELARRLGTGVDKIYSLIESGELQAVNLAVDVDGERARWRISESAIEDFLENRSNKPAEPKPEKPKRRRRATTATKKYF